MAGAKFKYSHPNHYSNGADGTIRKGDRNLYRFLTVVVLTALLICISTVTRSVAGKSERHEEAPSRNVHRNASWWKDGKVADRTQRHLLNDDEAEENEGVDCSSIHLYQTKEDQCYFATVTKDCTADIQFLNYMDFVYCKTGGSFKGVATALLIFWWLFCFIGLAVTADDFFCPSLVVISKVLHLSPNIAGVTFLAFGNGSPDVFSAIAALSSGGDPALGLGGLLGAGMFVTTCVAGTISVVTPFQAMQRPFIRDVTFYLVLVYWTFTVLWRGYMYAIEAIGYIILYAIYVVTVAGSGSIYKRQQANKKEKEKARAKLDPLLAMALEEEEEAKSGLGGQRPSFNKQLSIEVGDIELGELTSDKDHDIRRLSITKDEDEDATETLPIHDKKSEDGEDGSEKSGGDEPETPMQQFLGAINPINTEEWGEMSWYGKIYEVAKAPILFPLCLTCPVVDFEDEENHNWCRYLQILQCFSAPVACIFLTRTALVRIGGVVPIWTIIIPLGIGLAIACVFTSKNDVKPVYHDTNDTTPPHVSRLIMRQVEREGINISSGVMAIVVCSVALIAFGFVGFLMGIIWIYTLANEIVSLLKTFGLVFNINDAILGLTLLAWGNSMGDWISDTVMARQGFARMGFSACFGGPYFNLSLGFGIPMLVSMISKGDAVRYGLAMTGVSLMLIGFLMLSLAFSLVFVVFVFRFSIQRIYGVCLLGIYISFLLLSILAACNVILPNFRS